MIFFPELKERNVKMADADDTTACPVCFEEFGSEDHVPRLLPCSHTICEDCLQELLRAHSVVCPECRKKHAAHNGTKSFPQNKYVFKILSALAEKSSVSPKFKRCHIHEREVSLFCKTKDCKVAICQLCLIEVHKNHNVVDIVQEGKFRLVHLDKFISQCKESLLVADADLTKKHANTLSLITKRKEHITAMFEKLKKSVNDDDKIAKSDIERKLALVNKNQNALKDLKETMQEETKVIDVQARMADIEDIEENLIAGLGNFKTYKYLDYEHENASVGNNLKSRITGKLVEKEYLVEFSSGPVLGNFCIQEGESCCLLLLFQRSKWTLFCCCVEQRRVVFLHGIGPTDRLCWYCGRRHITGTSQT